MRRPVWLPVVLALGLALALALGTSACEPADAGSSSAPASATRALTPEIETCSPWLVRALDHGYWLNPVHGGLLHAYIDFDVADYAYDKDLFVTLHVLRENGVVERMRHPLSYRGPLGGGREKWGSDGLRIYPDSVHHGAITAIVATPHALVDGDLCVPPSAFDLTDAVAIAAELEAEKAAAALEAERAAAELENENIETAPAPTSAPTPRTGLGSLPDAAVSGQSGLAAADARWAGFPTADISRAVDATWSADDALPEIDVRFAPYDDPEATLIAEIDAVTDAQRRDPDGHHYIHASVFDINDRRIADRLIAAHRAGVDVQLLTDGLHTEPWRSWETEYPRLQRAGVPVLGIYPDGETASNHTKIAVFDGEVAVTGSLNWDERAIEHNSETLVVVRSPELAHAYERVIRQIAGMPVPARAFVPESRLEVLYSRSENVPVTLAREIDRAEESVVVAMFTLRSLFFWDGARWRDLLDSLVEAQARGVAVTLLLESNISDAGEYFGRITPDDPTDEWLADAGIEVVEIHTGYGGDPYAAMHHKFAVIDGQTTLVGAYNWYGTSQVSHDDLLIIRDERIARRFLGEVTNLRARYDETFDPRKAPTTTVTFSAFHDGTVWGQSLCLVGDLPELGSWEPADCVPMDAAAWPHWSATVDLPAGLHFAYKFLVLEGERASWEPGANRTHTASPQGSAEQVTDGFRR